MPKKMHLMLEHKKPGMLYVFIIGFLIGIVFVVIFSKAEFLQEGYFSIYALERLRYLQVDKRTLFWEVLQNRFQIVVLILVLSTTIIGGAVGYLFSTWYGFSLGLMGAIMVSRFGIKGGILFFACIFPQILIYMPAFYGIFHQCQNFRKGNAKGLYTIKLLIGIGVVIIGILTESYVNPNLISDIVIFLKLM